MNNQEKIVHQLNQYAWCMSVIKLRLNFLGETLSKNNSTLGTGYLVPDVEIGAIQLRKSLELIAMSSISANEEEYSAVHETFKKHWNARLIVREIEKINPDFYPRPISHEKNGKVNFTPDIDFLTKDRFMKLYEWCGSRLHALNPYRKDRDEGVKFKNDLIKIEVARQRIIRLLNQHRTVLSDDRTEIWCHMESPTQNGNPQAYLMDKIKS